MSSDHSRRKFRRLIRICFLVMAGLLAAGVLFLIFVPHLDGPHSRRTAHESVAVGSLRTVVRLQSKYAAADAVKGFACELRLLQSVEPKGAIPTTTHWVFSPRERGRATGLRLTVARSITTERSRTIKYPLFRLSRVLVGACGASALTRPA